MFRCGCGGRCGGGTGLSLRGWQGGRDACVGRGGFVVFERMREMGCASARGLLGSSGGGELGIYRVMKLKPRVKNTGRAGLYP